MDPPFILGGHILGFQQQPDTKFQPIAMVLWTSSLPSLARFCKSYREAHLSHAAVPLSLLLAVTALLFPLHYLHYPNGAYLSLVSTNLLSILLKPKTMFYHFPSFMFFWESETVLSLQYSRWNASRKKTKDLFTRTQKQMVLPNFDAWIWILILYV
jgi:hypothetical protein